MSAQLAWQTPPGHGLQSSLQLAVQSGNAPPAEPPHVAPPRFEPSHSSPGSSIPLPHGLLPAVVVVVLVVVVVVVLVGLEGSMATTPATKVSTLVSIVILSLVVAQPPFASALSQAALNLSPAFCRQNGSTVVAFKVALAWHLSFEYAFLPVAFSLRAAQSRAAWVVSNAPAGEPVRSLTTSSTKPSTLLSIMPLSLVVTQPP